MVYWTQNASVLHKRKLDSEPEGSVPCRRLWTAKPVSTRQYPRNKKMSPPTERAQPHTDHIASHNSDVAEISQQPGHQTWYASDCYIRESCLVTQKGLWRVLSNLSVQVHLEGSIHVLRRSATYWNSVATRGSHGITWISSSRGYLSSLSIKHSTESGICQSVM